MGRINAASRVVYTGGDANAFVKSGLVGVVCSLNLQELFMCSETNSSKVEFHIGSNLVQQFIHNSCLQRLS